MIIMKPQVLVPESQVQPLVCQKLSRYARVCYKSEDKMGNENAGEFLKSLIIRGHESVIEHEKITVMFIVDRGISHEIVRHRIASYSQESTRYCNYGNDKFGNEITVIKPFFFSDKKYECWKKACQVAEESYISLLKQNCSPQEARSVLPNSLKTEIVTTFNMREWRHFFRLRCGVGAHPQMKQVTIPLLLMFKDKIPTLFDDISYDNNFKPEHYGDIVLTNDLFKPLSI